MINTWFAPRGGTAIVKHKSKGKLVFFDRKNGCTPIGCRNILITIGSFFVTSKRDSIHSSPAHVGLKNAHDSALGLVSSVDNNKTRNRNHR